MPNIVVWKSHGHEYDAHMYYEGVEKKVKGRDGANKNEVDTKMAKNNR